MICLCFSDEQQDEVPDQEEDVEEEQEDVEEEQEDAEEEQEDFEEEHVDVDDEDMESSGVCSGRSAARAGGPAVVGGLVVVEGLLVVGWLLVVGGLASSTRDLMILMLACILCQHLHQPAQLGYILVNMCSGTHFILQLIFSIFSLL